MFELEPLNSEIEKAFVVLSVTSRHLSRNSLEGFLRLRAINGVFLPCARRKNTFIASRCIKYRMHQRANVEIFTHEIAILNRIRSNRHAAPRCIMYYCCLTPCIYWELSATLFSLLSILSVYFTNTSEKCFSFVLRFVCLVIQESIRYVSCLLKTL